MSTSNYTINELKAIFDGMAENIPMAKRTRSGVLLPLDNNGSFYHVTNAHKRGTPEHLKYGDSWFEYKIICNSEEYERILNPKVLEDHLLKLRANAILDHMRAIRVFAERFKHSQEVSLSKWYRNNDRDNKYLDNISKGNLRKLSKVPAGTAMINRANAICMKLNEGNIIVVSEKMMYALYFFNIFIYGTSLGFDEQECFIGYVIALRTYYGYESIDFDLDSRGVFDDETEGHLQKLTTDQYNFILGHEYAHHLLGHLDDSKLIDECNFGGDKTGRLTHYKHRFKEEYDADWHAIKNVTGNNKFKDDLTNAAFSCFLFFYVLESVDEYLSPRGNSKPRTHPPALDRISQLRKRVRSSFGINNDYLENVQKYVDQITLHFLTELLPFNMDEFEIYGSYYFHRFKPIIQRDRIDF